MYFVMQPKQKTVISLFSLLSVGTIVCLTLFLTGCTTSAPTTYSKQTQDKDSAPHPKHIPKHLDKIKDPVPKVEPLSRYGNRFKNSNSYVALKKRYTVMPTSRDYCAHGLASWYGTKFQGRRTSSGEPYDMFSMTAAHKTLPLPTYARVTNLDNGKSVIVKINDRGPFHKNRIIDLSYVAAHKLDILGKGTGRVRVESIDPRDHHGKVPKSKNRMMAKNSDHRRQQPQPRFNHHNNQQINQQPTHDPMQEEASLPLATSAVSGATAASAKSTSSVTSAASATAKSTNSVTSAASAAAKATSSVTSTTSAATKSKAFTPSEASSTHAAINEKPPQSPNKKLYLQVGAFKQKSLAENLANKISNLANAPTSIAAETNQNKSLFKVRLGPFTNSKHLAHAKKALQQANIQDAVTIKE